MKNCDTCSNFTRFKLWQGRLGFCKHTDYNIEFTKIGTCKYYRAKKYRDFRNCKLSVKSKNLKRFHNGI